MKNVLVPSTKISKKVGVPSVEGRKKSMSCIITLYSHCAGGTICNDQWSLSLTAGGSRGTVYPPVGQGQGPGGVQGAKLRFYACYFRKETMPH